jgi:hypothetical protein
MGESVRHAAWLLPLLFVLMVTACRPTAAPPNPADAWTMCKDRVLDRLKAPATAQFPAYDPAMVGTSGAAVAAYTIASYVDSQNSFGAQLRSHFMCKVEWTGQEWRFVDLAFEDDKPTPAPELTPTPDATAAAGVLVRLDPVPSSRGSVYPAGTRFTFLYAVEQSPGVGWQFVMAPDGTKGWIPIGDPHAVVIHLTPTPAH